jgi:HEAT repeat protein
MEGYVIARSKGVLWVIPSAEPVAINEEDISDTVGNADPTSGGLALSGDMQADARRMIEELASEDKMRMTIAATVLDKFGAEIAPVLIESLGHENPLVRKQCIALLQNYRVKHAVGPVVAVLRGDADPEVRVVAAGSLIDWNAPETRKVLLDVVARDRSEDVKSAALNTLARCATIEDASPLFDLLPMFEPGSNLEKSLFGCFKRTTEQQFADDRDVWRKWWLDDGGREAIAEKVEKLQEERRSTPPRSPDDQ